jgi:hypothetical protein
VLQGGLIDYAPASSFAHGDNPAYAEYHWHGLQLVAGNLYVLIGLGLLAVALAAAFAVARLRGGTARLLRAGVLVDPAEAAGGGNPREVRGEP